MRTNVARLLCRIRRLAGLALVGIAMAHAQGVTEMRVVNESAPGGGVAVVVIELTEPEPIITGRFSFSYSGGPLRQVRGVGLFSSQLDVIGAARLTANSVNVRFASFSGQVGATPDLPIGVIALDVEGGASEGSQGNFVVDDVEIISPGGQPYSNSVKQGSFTVGGLSVNSVSPFTGIVQSGQTITLQGVGFDVDAEVRIDEVALSETQVISASELRVVAQQQFRIDGREISVRNKEADEEDVFYVYQSAALIGTTQHDYLRDIVPVFDTTTLTRGLLRNVASGGADLTGVAVQNPGGATASVQVDVLDGSQALLGSKTLNLTSGARAMYEVSDVTGGPQQVSGGFIVVTSTAPLNMVGLTGTTSDSSATPIALEDDPLPPTGDPTISEGGVVLATLAPPLTSGAPRALVSVFGSNLAPQGTQASVSESDITEGGMLPRVLAGACVEINGVRAPLLFVSQSQINAQVPDLAAVGPVGVTVLRACDTPDQASSAPVNFTLNTEAPGFFLFGVDPQSNPVAALHGSGPDPVGDPQALPGALPAAPGEVISLFGTGLGATAGGLAAGVIPILAGPIDVEALRAVASISVTVGGVVVPPEDIFFAGAAPCCSGLDQITIRVPASVPDGDLPIVMTVNGRPSPDGPYLTVSAPQ